MISNEEKDKVKNFTKTLYINFFFVESEDAYSNLSDEDIYLYRIIETTSIKKEALHLEKERSNNNGRVSIRTKRTI